MSTGVHRIAKAVLIDKELQCQAGITLHAWAERHGVPFHTLVRLVEGKMAGCEELLTELANDIGISVTTLRRIESLRRLG